MYFFIGILFIKLLKLPIRKVSYVSPDVSTTNAPNPKNGGTEIQREKIQMKAMMRKEVL